jgi:hypothetical protein
MGPAEEDDRERDLLRGRDELERVRVLDGRVRVAPRGEDEAIERRLPTVSPRTPLPARCVAPHCKRDALTRSRRPNDAHTVHATKAARV